MAGRRIGIRIDMTPMVDVAFLLLIFFMTTTQFKPPERVSVMLPTSRSDVQVPETDTIILTVNKQGEIYISGDNVAETQSVLKEDLTSPSRPGGAGTRRGGEGDKDADFGTVATSGRHGPDQDSLST
jgi:biopolymer transport protein ExbD